MQIAGHDLIDVPEWNARCVREGKTRHVLDRLPPAQMEHLRSTRGYYFRAWIAWPDEGHPFKLTPVEVKLRSKGMKATDTKVHMTVYENIRLPDGSILREGTPIEGVEARLLGPLA